MLEMIATMLSHQASMPLILQKPMKRFSVGRTVVSKLVVFVFLHMIAWTTEVIPSALVNELFFSFVFVNTPTTGEQILEGQETVQRSSAVRVVQHAHRAMVQPPRVPGRDALQRSRGEEHVRPAAEEVVQCLRPRELQGTRALLAAGSEPSLRPNSVLMWS